MTKVLDAYMRRNYKILKSIIEVDRLPKNKIFIGSYQSISSVFRYYISRGVIYKQTHLINIDVYYTYRIG